jgi:high-affinity iron transporter
VLSSLAIGAVLTAGARELPPTLESVFAATGSIIAVAMVTWMLFWLSGKAAGLGSQLRAQAGRAVGVGDWAVGVLGFVLVGREGLEMALFIWSSTLQSGPVALPLVGALLGVGGAAVLGWLLYRGLARIDLGRFFRWTGVALLVTAAGVLGHAVRELQSIGALPGDRTLAFDLGPVLGQESVAATLTQALFGLSGSVTWAQAAVFAAYLALMLPAVAGRSRRRSGATASQLAASR